MTVRETFVATIQAEGIGRLGLSDDGRERVTLVLGKALTQHDVFEMDANRAYYDLLVERAAELESELDDAHKKIRKDEEINPEHLSPSARCLWEATNGNDTRAYDLASTIPTRDADAILYATLIDLDVSEPENQFMVEEELQRKHSRLVQFGFDFAEENSSPAMKAELVRLALDECMEDDADGKNFAKVESLLGRPMTETERDLFLLRGRAHIFGLPGIDMAPFVKQLFRYGGSDLLVRLTAIEMLDWDDENEGCSFIDLLQYLPDK